MFDWIYHLLGLNSPRELLQLNEHWGKDMRGAELRLARAMAESLTGELRAKAMTQIAEAERKEGFTMLLGDIRLTADDCVQILDVDGSIQATLTVGDALELSHRLMQMQDLLLERYRQQLARDRAKAKETQS